VCVCGGDFFAEGVVVFLVHGKCWWFLWPGDGIVVDLALVVAATGWWW
jgi:hypothetical protein